MDPFLAQIVMFGSNFAPRGWANCDGQLLAISQYSALFSLLGTIYGGDGRTTFALPELRGRMAMHTGNGPGLAPRQMGQKSGQENVTQTVAQMANHNHTASSTAQVAVAAVPGGEGVVSGQHIANHAGAFSEDATGATLGGVTAATTVNANGGQQPQNNLPPYTVVRYIIALQGTYPSRN